MSGTAYFCVHLSWDDPRDPSITRWEVERATPSAPSTWVKGSLAWSSNRVPSSDASTTSVVVAAGAANAGAYKFRVRAVNAAGAGPWSDEVSLVVGAGDAKPILLPATAGNGRVALRWRYHGAQSATCGTSCWDVNTTAIADSGPDLRAHTVTDLTNGQTYTYKVRTYVDKAGNLNTAGPESNQVSVTLPAAPAKPAGLTAKPAPAGASLSWTDPDNGAITGWQYRQKAGAGTYGSWTRVPGSDGGTTAFSVSGLANGTEHKLQVRAVIEYETALGGTLAGAASDEVSVTPVGVAVSKDHLALTEGGAAGTYTVALSHAPTQDVTITVSVDSDGTVTADTDDVTTGSQTTLTFTSTNYATAQTVKVKAAADDDGRHSTATIAHTVSSTDARYGNLVGLPGLTVAVTDDDALGLALSASSVPVPEGGTATYTVKLGSKPTGTVTVTIARASGGDTDLTVSPSSLAFTTSNWDSAQTVTVSAAEDDGDVIDGAATFTHTAAGGGYGGVSATLTATETDDEEGIVLSASSVSVPEARHGDVHGEAGRGAERRRDGDDRPRRRRRHGPDGGHGPGGGQPEQEDAGVHGEQLEQRADGDGVRGRGRRRHRRRRGDVHPHRLGRGQRPRRGERDPDRDGGGRRAGDRAGAVERVGARGRHGDVHGGAGRDADRHRDGDDRPRRRRRHGPGHCGHGRRHAGPPEHADVHDEQLGQRADGDGVGGRGRRRRRQRHGDVHAHRLGRRAAATPGRPRP